MSLVGGSGNPGEFQRDAFFMQEPAPKCQGRARRELGGRVGDVVFFFFPSPAGRRRPGWDGFLRNGNVEPGRHVPSERLSHCDGEGDGTNGADWGLN